MPYGYIGQNLPNQTVSNSGVFSISDVADLEKQGKFGGSLELIEEQTISSSVATVNFTSLQETKYDVHLLQYNDLKSVNNNVLLCARFSNNGGSSYITSGYQYAHQWGRGSGTFGENKSTSTDKLVIGVNQGADTNEKNNGYVYFYNLANSSKYSFSTYQQVALYTDANVIFSFGGAVHPTAETINALQLLFSTANIASGNIKLYGVKQL